MAAAPGDSGGCRAVHRLSPVPIARAGGCGSGARADLRGVAHGFGLAIHRRARGRQWDGRVAGRHRAFAVGGRTESAPVSSKFRHWWPLYVAGAIVLLAAALEVRMYKFSPAHARHTSRVEEWVLVRRWRELVHR